MLRLLPVLLLAPTAALAHAGAGPQGSPFASGLAHPLLGPDHLLAMIAVGLFAAMTAGRAVWAFPASFLGAMVAGGILGFEGIEAPMAEPTTLASVIVLGAAVAFALRPPLALACAAIAVFGAAHGHAHGLEGPPLGAVSYAAGFVIATAALHGTGLALGLAAGRLERPAVGRALGGLACLAGLALASA